MSIKMGSVIPKDVKKEVYNMVSDMEAKKLALVLKKIREERKKGRTIGIKTSEL